MNFIDLVIKTCQLCVFSSSGGSKRIEGTEGNSRITLKSLKSANCVPSVPVLKRKPSTELKAPQVTPVRSWENITLFLTAIPNGFDRFETIFEICGWRTHTAELFLKTWGLLQNVLRGFRTLHASLH